MKRSDIFLSLFEMITLNNFGQFQVTKKLSLAVSVLIVKQNGHVSY